MRILQVNNINQIARIYGSALIKHGHSVTVYEPSFVGGLAPLPIKLAMMPWRILHMGQVVGKLNPNYFDIVHIHWASYGLLGLGSQIPFIIHCHGKDVLQPTFPPILQSLFQRAAAVLCITPDLMPHVQPMRPDAIFFPGPIDTDHFAPLGRDHSLQARPWTILHLSRLDPDKGNDIAVQGMAQFAARHRGIRVQILDWGTLKEQYKQRYGKQFEFIPRVPPEEVPNLIRAADVVVGQFFLGALGLSELQAMSCAKPVIALFRYEEAYSTPPPLCQAMTAEEVDEQLEHLFQHPEAATTIGQRGREWVIHYHEYQALSDKLETLYQSILGCTSSVS